MTTQIRDSIRYQGRFFCIEEATGVGMFTPASHGLKPVPLATACHRGFVCSFSLTDGTLRLEALLLGIDPLSRLRIKYGKATPLLGRPPQLDERFGNAAVYPSLDWPVPLTGGLRLGAGFIHRSLLAPDFDPLWPYEEAHELCFEDGALIEAHDRTEALARLRQAHPLPARRDLGREAHHALLSQVFPLTT